MQVLLIAGAARVGIAQSVAPDRAHGPPEAALAMASTPLPEGKSVEEQCLAVWEAWKVEATIASCQDLAGSSEIQGTSALAVELALQGCRLERESDDAFQLGEGWGNIGEQAAELNRPVLAEAALQKWRAARVLASRGKDLGWWLEDPINALVMLHVQQGRPKEAVAVMREFVAITDPDGLCSPTATSTDAPPPQGTDSTCSLATLNAALRLAQLQRSSEDGAAALATLDRYFTTDLDEADVRPEVLFEMARSYDSLERFDDADATYEALRAVVKPGSRLQATAHHHHGQALHALGRYEDARRAFQASLETKQTVHGLSRAATLHALGWMEESIGRFRVAETLYVEAVTVSRAEIDDYLSTPLGLAKTLGNLGWLYDHWDKPASARAAYDEAWEILNGLPEELVGAPRFRILLLHSEGIHALKTDQPSKAVEAMQESHDRALALFKEGHPQLAVISAGLVRALVASGSQEEAEPVLASALSAAVASTSPAARWEAFDAASTWHEAADRTAEAVFWSKMAVAELQSVRQELEAGESTSQESFVMRNEEVYRRLIGLLIHESRLAEAEEALELLKQTEQERFHRGSAQEDTLPLRPAEETWSGRVQSGSESVVTASRAYHNLRRVSERTPEQEAELLELRTALRTANKAFSATLAELRAAFEAESTARVEELGAQKLDSLRGMQGKLDQGDRRAVLLSAIVTEDTLFLLLTTPETRVSRTVAVSRAELNQHIVAFRQALKSPSVDPRPLGLKLHQLLVAPIEKDLAAAQADVLLLSLDQNLRYIPFPALYDGEDFLVERLPTAMLTPTAASTTGGQVSTLREVTALGVSTAHAPFGPLASVPLELKAVTDVVSGESFLDDAFDEMALSDALLGGAASVHLATHFKFEPGTAQDSFLLLGDGKHLTIQSLLERDFDFPLHDVDLLVLSACETAMGEVGADGAEVEGLAGVAQQSGVDSVLATLWPVADASTATWMELMYRFRASGEQTTSESIQQAQLALLKEQWAAVEDLSTRGLAATADAAAEAPQGLEGWRHPYYWAPFVLFGAW